MNKLVKALNKKITLRASQADLIFGAVVVVLNAWLFFVGVPKFIELGVGNKYGTTPQTLPKAIFLAAMILGVLLIVESWGTFKKKAEDEKTVSFHLISLCILADLALFVFTLKPLGYPIANVIMIYIMYWLSGGKKWWKGLVLALIFTTVCVLFFFYYLKLSIPMGPLSDIII